MAKKNIEIVCFALACLFIPILGMGLVSGDVSESESSILLSYKDITYNYTSTKSLIDNGTYSLSLDGNTYNLYLINNNLFSKITNSNFSCVNTYQGYVQNHPNSTVRLTIGPHYMGGMINFKNTTYFIEPKRNLFSDANSDSMIIYKSKDHKIKLYPST